MLKPYLFCSFLLTLFALSDLIAQPDIEWQKSLGGSHIDIATAILQAPDGGIVVVGESRSGDGDISDPFGLCDYWVAKLGVDGELLWEKSYGGSNYDVARAACLTSDGGYVVVGSSRSEDGQVSEALGSDDVWMIKLSGEGELEWERSFGGSSGDDAYAVKQTPDGGYFIGGSTQSTNGDISGLNGDADYWALRLDSAGAILWSKVYGGSKVDFVFDLDLTSDGGCVLAGRTRSRDGDVSGHHGGGSFVFDNWVVKLSSEGALEWERALGGTDNDEGRAICQARDGGYLVAGVSRSTDGDVSTNNGSWDAWVVKLDSAGTISWEKSYGGRSGESADAVFQTSDEGYIVSGCTGPAGDKDFWTIKITADGELDWQLPLGGTDDERSFAVQQTADDGFIIAGRSNSDNGDVSSNQGDYDFWVVKLAACGVNTEVLLQEDSLQSLEVALSSTYQWIDCRTGAPISGQQSASFRPPVGGEYAVILTNGECLDTSDCITFCPFSEQLLLIEDSTLMIEEDTSGLSVQWINCNTGANIDGATSNSYTPISNGAYAAVIQDDNCSITTECLTLCPEPIDVEIVQLADTLFAITDSNATFFQWYDCNTDLPISNAIQAYFVPTQNGEYGVFVNQGECRSALVCYDYCLINTSLQVEENTIISQADTLSSTFQWMDCRDSSFIPDEQHYTFSPINNGTYAVMITQGSCSALSECVDITVVATKEQYASGAVTVFPIPALESLTVSSTNDKMAYDFKVFNQQGIEQLSGKLQASRAQIDISTLSSGLYYLLLEDGDQRLIKEFVKL